MRFAYEIVSKQDVSDLVEQIVNMSNEEISNNKFEGLPETAKTLARSIVFYHKKKKRKEYIVVFIPYNLSRFSLNLLDRVLGLSSRLKKVFDSQNINVKIRLVKWEDGD